MKVCLINNLYKPFNKGGAERIVELVAENFNELGIETFVIASRPYFKKNVFSNKKNIYFLSAFYYNLYILPKFLRIFWHLYKIFDLRIYYKVKKILTIEKPDFVITNNLLGLSYLVPMAIKKLKLKHIHILHDIQLLHPSGLLIAGREKKIDTFYAKVYQLITKRLFRDIPIIISPSLWLFDVHRKKNFFISAKHEIIHNPAFLPQVKRIREEGNKDVFFLYVGQLEEHKGLKMLIEAFKTGKFDNCNLEIVGSGSLENLVKEEALKNQIIYHGAKSHREIANIMKSSGAICLIIPSLCYENSPTVFYEAALCKLPVIAPGLGGLAELLSEIGGIEFAYSSKKSLQEKMLWALKNPEKIKKIGEKAFYNIDIFNTKNYLKKLRKIISQSSNNIF